MEPTCRKITANKANGVLVLVKRTCRDLKGIDTMKTLYSCRVRPLLVYIFMGNLEASY